MLLSLGWGVRRSVRLAGVAMVLAVLGGCNGLPTTIIKPQPVSAAVLEQPSSGRYDVVAIGGITGSWASSEDQLYFRRRLVEALRRSKEFAKVQDPAPEPLPASVLHLTAGLSLKRVCREMINWKLSGCRRWTYTSDAKVELRDSKGDQVIWFEVSSHRHRVSTVGSDENKDHSLFGSMADEAAAAIVRWSRGESLVQEAEPLKSYGKAAEQGDALAQFKLGLMYDIGRGVPQDGGAAVKWYRRAAEQGHAKAQYLLGGWFRNGFRVPKDPVRAQMWLILAVKNSPPGRPREYMAANRDKFARDLTPAQLTEAQRLAREWKPKKE